MTDRVPVITIDGPSGSGKGTVTQRVAPGWAGAFGFGRALPAWSGFATISGRSGFEDENKISEIANKLNVRLITGRSFSTVAR